ncbi:hypothetical protein O1L60_31985 [Streptomyces diastatochromogenes]|nr:hypothetical protein [Streptomyces diastatochromogenes]
MTAARIEENRSTPPPRPARRLPPGQPGRAGRAVAGVAGLAAVYRAEAEDPVGAFAADTVLLATPAGAEEPAGCVVLKAPRRAARPRSSGSGWRPGPGGRGSRGPS